MKKSCIVFSVLFTFFLSMFFVNAAIGQPDKPNILIIWGDDIGYWNISAYNRGMMGYRTPNIDRSQSILKLLYR